MRRMLLLAALAMKAVCQAPPPTAFEAASVKPTQHGRNAAGESRSSLGSSGPKRFMAENSSLDELIRYAYGLKDNQISGPKWLNDDNESFDIAATLPAGASDKQMPQMVQALLAERFHLVAHRETRLLPIYEMVAGKNRATLKPGDPAGHASTSSNGSTLTATSITMPEFANQLTRRLKRTVIDKTGIDGRFDIVLHYTENDQDTTGAPALLAALQQTTGLRLESAKGPVEILVVDSIDRAPSEN